jgi:hypothetical protein
VQFALPCNLTIEPCCRPASQILQARLVRQGATTRTGSSLYFCNIPVITLLYHRSLVGTMMIMANLKPALLACPLLSFSVQLPPLPPPPLSLHPSTAGSFLPLPQFSSQVLCPTPCAPPPSLHPQTDCFIGQLSISIVRPCSSLCGLSRARKRNRCLLCHPKLANLARFVCLTPGLTAPRGPQKSRWHCCRALEN